MKRASTIVALQLLLVFYSISAILSKFAGEYEFGTPAFFGFYCAVVAILGIYAIGWQQILKRLPLTTTYANKAVTVIWGFIWGLLFFGEEITFGKIIAAVVIIAGVVCFALADRGDDAQTPQPASAGAEGEGRADDE